MDMKPPKSPFGHSQIGTFYQPHFERVLLGGLERFVSARALFGHTVTALAQDRDGVDVRIETPHGQRKLRAKFVVGCDGGASATRDAIGAQMVGATYAERWLIINALIDDHDVDNITFFCDPRRPTVRLRAVGHVSGSNSCNCQAKIPMSLPAMDALKNSSHRIPISPVSKSSGVWSTLFTPASPTSGARGAYY